MPALLLLRHAKSDWQADYDDDRHRPLNRRGERAAARIGRFIADAEQVPDSAICSPALRATDTLRLAMEVGGWACPSRSSEDLYGGGVSSLLAEVQREPDATAVLLVVGHEPTWSQAASVLIGGGRVRVPTGALVRIELEIERWQEVRPGIGVLAWSVVPRLMEAS